MLEIRSRSKARWFGVSIVVVGALGVGAAPAATYAKDNSGESPPTTVPSERSDLSPVGLAEIIVTATKRATSLQSTPVAITALTGAALEEAQIDDIRDLQRLTPGLVVSANAGQENPISLRGISSGIQGIGGDSPVAIYLDGVYIGRPQGALFELPDVERIEVARGPQGTLSGRNSTAGAINIVTSQPDDAFSGSALVRYGSAKELALRGTLNIPLSDNLFFKIGAAHRQNAGYQRDAITGRRVNEERNTVVNGGLRYEPTSEFAIDLRADYSHTKIPVFTRFLSPSIPKYGLRDCAIDCDLVYISERDAFQKTESGGVGLTAAYQFGFAELKSITAYRFQRGETLGDNDQVEFRLAKFSTINKSKQFSQEFTLSSASGGPFTWVAGLYYFHEKSTSDYALQFYQTDTRSLVIGGLADVSTDSYAAYANASYEVADRLSFTLGARYSTEQKDFDRIGGQGIFNVVVNGPIAPRPAYALQYDLSRKFEYFDPRADIQFKITPRNYLYASVSRGSKSGGFSFAAQGTADPSFRPEKLTAFEIGSKNMFFDNQFRANLTAFYYDYTDLQQSLTPLPGVRSIYNAASAKVKGVEVELALKPRGIAGLQLSATGSFLDGNFDRFAVDFSGLGAAGAAGQCDGGRLSATLTCDFSGNILPRSPRFQATVIAQYDIDLASAGTLTPRAQLAYSGRYYYTANNSSPAGEARESAILDAQLSYAPRGSNMKFSIWGRNLTDRRFVATSIIQNLNPSAVTGTPFPRGVVGYFGLANAPRSYGVEASVRF